MTNKILELSLEILVSKRSIQSFYDINFSGHLDKKNLKWGPKFHSQHLSKCPLFNRCNFSNLLLHYASSSQRHPQSTLTLLHQATMAKFNKIAVLLWVDMAITMVNIGVYAENRKNVDNLRKQIEKKVMNK